MCTTIEAIAQVEAMNAINSMFLLLVGSLIDKKKNLSGLFPNQSQ